ILDYSRNDPSPPDLSRIFPKPKSTVFGVFPYIFRTKETIATIPEIIRALPTFSRIFPILPELSRRLETPCLGIDYEYPRNDPSPPDLSRTLPKPKTTVRGIDCDYSRNDPSPPDLSRSLKPPSLASFLTFLRYRESIWTTPEAIQTLPNCPDFSRALLKFK
ncbi:hypothetical protein NQ317_006084, partial [Molorchus minor]